jgi:hypothetical protein
VQSAVAAGLHRVFVLPPRVTVSVLTVLCNRGTTAAAAVRVHGGCPSARCPWSSATAGRGVREARCERIRCRGGVVVLKRRRGRFLPQIPYAHELWHSDEAAAHFPPLEKEKEKLADAPPKLAPKPPATTVSVSRIAIQCSQRADQAMERVGAVTAIVILPPFSLEHVLEQVVCIAKFEPAATRLGKCCVLSPRGCACAKKCAGSETAQHGPIPSCHAPLTACRVAQGLRITERYSSGLVD